MLKQHNEASSSIASIKNSAQMHWVCTVFEHSSTNLLISDGVPHVEGVVLQGVLGLNLLLVSLVLTLVLLSLLNHPFDLILAEPALVIGDGDLVLVTCNRWQK